MQLADKVIVVTGAGSGIGRALCQRFAKDKPAAVVAADLNGEGAAETARAVGGTACTLDVTREEQVQALVQDTLARHGRIDLFCSNAGIAVGRDETSPDS